MILITRSMERGFRFGNREDSDMRSHATRKISDRLQKRFSRRHVLMTTGVVALGTRSAAAQGTAVSDTPSPMPTQIDLQWPIYGHDLSGDKSTPDAGVSTQTVDSLGPLWEVDVGGPVSATPVIAGGVVYIGSYDGSLDAINLRSGAIQWTYETGTAVEEPNLKIPLGITGSAAVADGVVYLGDASAKVHAIDQQSGTALWTTIVDNQPEASIWSSPVVVGNTLFVGVASIAKGQGFRGNVVALDASSGEVRWQSFMVPEGADGAGVFAVPAIDEQRGLLYIGTQNAYTAHPAPYGNPISMVALDMESGDTVWAFNAPPNGGDNAPIDDVAFSASPNLFSATINGINRDLVGEGQKSGVYWALDRDTGEVVWQSTVSPSGFLGGMEGTSAVSNGVIAVPATDWPEVDGAAQGMVVVLDAATGEILWTAKQEAPAASPAAISDDLVFHAGMDGILHAYALANGEELWRTDLGASVSGGVAIADGVVVLGASTPSFAPFVRPGTSIRAFAIDAGEATPTGATPVS